MLRNAPGASTATRDRVVRAAAELGYRPDTAAQVLRRSRSRHIGVLFTMRQPFDVDLVEALIMDGTTIEAAQLTRIADQIPVVDIGRRATGDSVDVVRVADEHGARLAVDHLAGLGHRSIVHIDGGDQPGAAERRRGYRRAMRRHGLQHEIRVLPGDYAEESGATAGRRILSDGPLPTAIFAANDRCARGLLDTLSVPDTGTPEVDLERTGGMHVALDETFAAATRIQLDDTSWIDHIPGWLAGDGELMEALMTQASWEQRSRWMYTRMVTEPRLTAEYPVVADAPQPVLHYLAEVLSAHYGRPYARLWMNWYRDNDDGTGWHADRPANKQGEAVIPVLSLGATRRFLIRPEGGGRSTTIVTHGGDLVVMGGRCQKDYQHSVPKQKQAAGARLRLNFSIAPPAE